MNNFHQDRYSGFVKCGRRVEEEKVASYEKSSLELIDFINNEKTALKVKVWHFQYMFCMNENELYLAGTCKLLTFNSGVLWFIGECWFIQYNNNVVNCLLVKSKEQQFSQIG